MTRTITAVATGLFTGVLLACVSQASAQSIGKADRTEASVTAEQQKDVRALGAGSKIIYNDELKTGAGGRLQATLDDGTQLTLGEKGHLTVDDFVYDPNKAGGSLDIKVTKGAFLFVGGKVEHSNGATVAIHTPVATLGVRGTTVWGGPIDGGYGVLVLSGEVWVKTKHGMVDLKQGQGTMIKSATAAAAAPWPEDRTKRAVASISFKP